MPYDEYDAEDPLELVGCAIPLDDGFLTEMTECFIGEFARLGYGADALLGLFRNPFYRGPHNVYQVRGEDYVRQMIAEIVGEWPARTSVRTDLVAIQPLQSSPKE